MVRHDLPSSIEPERRQLGEHLAFVGDAGAEHVIECRNTIRGDDQQSFGDFVDVPDLASSMRSNSIQACFEEGGSEHCREARILQVTRFCSQLYATAPVLAHVGPDILWV